jgi:hypothetical protein
LRAVSAHPGSDFTSWRFIQAAAGADGYVDNESEDFSNDARLSLSRGGESVVTDSAVNVYVADGQIFVDARAAKELGRIDVSEQPLLIPFSGPDRARSSSLPSHAPCDEAADARLKCSQ